MPLASKGTGGGFVEKGRVRSRSAREYRCVMKYVWASQNASFGSSVLRVSGKWTEKDGEDVTAHGSRREPCRPKRRPCRTDVA